MTLEFKPNNLNNWDVNSEDEVKFNVGNFHLFNKSSEKQSL